MADPSPQPQSVNLETDVSLSRSMIWQLQRDFYIRRGVKAWTEDLVPNFITNNPFIAEIYCRIVFAFIRDLGNVLSADQPLRILELGAGTGKFSYLFLRQLTALFRDKGVSPKVVRYCMSDCSPELIESWRSNSYLQEFTSSGMLDFQVLQAGDAIHSAFLGRKGPLVIIANYVFDSLPQDAFVIQDSRISEALVTTSAPADHNAGTTPELSRLQLSYKNTDVAASRYADPSWNDILEQYRTRLSAATVFFPTQTLQLLQELAAFSNVHILVLAADKGVAHEESLSLFQGPPSLEFHGANCFSQMVNFDAIGKYFTSSGGQALLPEKHFATLNICAFLHGERSDPFQATTAAYRQSQAGFGPDDLFALFTWLNAHVEEMTTAQVLAALRLTRWDPIALNRFFPVLGRQLRSVSAERYDLRDAVMKTWANHFPVHPSENVIAFNCGVILLELRFHEEALSMFKVSEKILGPSATTSYNMGLCAQGLGRTSEALQYMVRATEQDPNFESAKQFRQKLQAQTS
jgi:tetratricopeptide (TPR) repeat protein